MPKLFPFPKALMVSVSLFLVVLGVAGLFAPQEMTTLLGLPTGNTLLIEVLGGIYVAFAIMNWTAKDTAIGGIYSRPVSLGNLAHFAIGAITLLKYASAHPSSTIINVTIMYTVFALLFGWLVFGPRISRGV